MSRIDVKSPKHCAEKQALNFPNFNKKLFYYLCSLILTIISIIFLVWLTLRPTNPKFALKESEINRFNLSGTQSLVLNSSIQLTILSTNPNKKVGIYYDEFLVYALYKGQKITPDASISPFYQGKEETNFLSACLVGNEQPVGSSLGYEVQHDREIGKLMLNFKIIGGLRWKVGTWVSGRHRFVVNCVSIVPFGPLPSPPLSSRQGTQCSTSV